MSKPWKPTVTLWSGIDKGYVTVALEVQIDWDKIARLLAAQALRSKHGKATQLHDALKAKIVSRSAT
jgi:hypothetical protein